MPLEPTSKKRSGGPLRVFLLALLLPAYLTSCSTSGTVQTTPQTVLPDEACLTPAEPLPKLLDPSLAGAIRNHVETANLYWELAARHRCLVEFERSR